MNDVMEPMWCDGCRATGAIHCAHPDQCGNMLSATAAADQWKAWLDDLPLPFTFDPAIGRLQDFITALTVRIDVPQPNNPEALAKSDTVQALVKAAVEAERERCARVVEKRAEDYDREFGIYDYSTGVTEYPGTGSESMEEWESTAAAIRVASAAIRKDEETFK